VVNEIGFGFEGSLPVTRAVALTAVATDTGIDTGIDVSVIPVEDSSVDGDSSSAHAVQRATGGRIPAPKLLSSVAFVRT